MSLLVYFNDTTHIVYTAVNVFHCDRQIPLLYIPFANQDWCCLVVENRVGRTACRRCICG